MKKIFIALISLIGCQQKITAFDEVIENNQVVIDGITYDIKSVIKTQFVYDKSDNIQEKIITYDDYTVISEYYYLNNQLSEERKYKDDEHISSILYSYDNDIIFK